MAVVLLLQTAFNIYTKKLDTNGKGSALYSYSMQTLFESLQQDRLFSLTLLVVFLSLSKKMYDQYLIWAKMAVFRIILQMIITNLLLIQRNKTLNILYVVKQIADKYQYKLKVN